MATDPRIRYDIEARASGAADVEKLAQEFQKLDGAFPDDLAGKVRTASQQLEQLGQQQQAVEAFARIKAETEQAKKALDEAQAAAQKFGREIAQTEAPTRAQAGQLQKLKDNVNAAKEELILQTQALDRARAGLTQFGISGEQVGQRSVELKQQIGAVRAEIESLGKTGSSATGFQQLVRETDAARQRMQETARAAEQLAAELQGVQRPTDGEAAKLRELRAAADTARADFERLQQTTVEQGLALRQAGVNTELLTAKTREAAAAQQQASAAAQRGANAYTEQGAAAQRAATQQTAAATNVRQGLEGIAGQLRSIQALAATVLGGQLLSGTIGDIARTADAYANLEGRIKLVTGEGAALRQAFDGVFDVALRTNSAVESTGTLFTRLAQANKDLGLSSTQAVQQALQLTETINQAIQVSGGSAESADAAVTQLIQGLQSGVLRGEEFNSVMEQAPRLARALADGLGVTTGQLRKLSEQGQLTAQSVIGALRSQSDTLKREFDQLPQTVSRALVNLSNEWTKFIGQLDRSSGSSAVVAEGINKIAANLDTIARLAAVAGAALTANLAVQGVKALRALSIEAAAASQSATILTASLSNIPKIVNITVAATGFEIGFQIGEMLYQNSQLARQLGVGVVAFFENILNDLQLLKDSAAAVFTSDTIEASFDRYRERGRQLDETFSQMWKDAEAVPRTLASAADQASASTDALATKGQAAGTQLSLSAGAAAAAVGRIGKEANTAEAALQGIAATAGQTLPKIGTTAAQQGAAMADLLLKSKDVAQVFSQNLPEALSKLSGAELERFRASLVNALQAAVTEADKLSQQMTVLAENEESAFTKGQRAARLLQEVLTQTGIQAAQSLGVDVVAASSRVSAAFQEQADRLSLLIRSLPELKAAGVDTGTVVAQAIGNMIDGARNQAEIDLVIARLQALGQQGTLTGEQVRAALQLGTDKAKELKQKLEDATPGISGLGEAARKAGVDVGLLTTGVSEGFAKGVQDIENLRVEIEKAGIGAERASPILADALDKRVQAAQTKEEVELLRKETEKLGASGKLTGDDLVDALEKVKQKAEEVSPRIQQLQKDAQLLGVEMKKSSEQGADGMIRAYERAKLSGEYSNAQLQQAFVNTAKKAIEAANGQIPEWVKVEAEFRNVRVEIDANGKAVLQMANDSTAAYNQIAVSLSGYGDKLDETNAKLEQQAILAEKAAEAERKRLNVDKDGFSLGKDGQRFTISRQINVPDGYTFDNAAFQRAQRNAAITGGPAPDPANFYVAPGAGFLEITDQTAAEQGLIRNGDAGYTPFGALAQQQETLRRQREAQQRAQRQAEAAARAASGSANVQIVRLQIGSSSTDVRVTSAADAAALTAFMNQLAAAARSAGINLST